MALQDVLVFFLLAATLQESNLHRIDPLQDKLDKEKDFLQPEFLSNKKVQFVYKDSIIFTFSSNELTWEEARAYCHSAFLNGILAIIDDGDKLEFLSEALTETSQFFDNLWIAGIRDMYGNWSTSYLLDNNLQYLPNDLIEQYNGTTNRFEANIKRNCLSFRRTYNQSGSFIDLHCSVQRPFICQRAYNFTPMNMTSTHPGWFQIGESYYKIFYDEVSWANASINCHKIDKYAKLAYVSNYSDARILSRYLLIGRPSLENAWIGARWNFDEESYVFDEENIKLDNITDKETNYPPWPSTVIKTGGCVLLDRHLERRTLFVPARCQRLRPYICYKTIHHPQIADNDSYAFPHADYQLHYNPLRFDEAVSACTYAINGNNGVLAQPKDLNEIKDILFIMGESTTYIQHVWLGGRLFNEKWMWLKKKEDATEPDEGSVNIPIKDENGYPPWVENTTYTEEVEHMNLCLNMDRENHLDPLFYGADCYYAQSYICQYPNGTLWPKRPTVTPFPTTVTEPLLSTDMDTMSTTESLVSTIPPITMETKDFPDLTILPQKPSQWDKENKRN